MFMIAIAVSSGCIQCAGRVRPALQAVTVPHNLPFMRRRERRQGKNS
jgi:hypothetical protein